MDTKTITKIVIFGILALILFQMMNQSKENFMQIFPQNKKNYVKCQRGYCPSDKDTLEYLKHQDYKHPCIQKYRLLGYDNPYIYPYSYNWNQNHPLDKYKFPQWVREINRSCEDEKFPGYTYH